MSYAGDITCKECWEILKNDADAQLLDVRTTAEWAFVGVPVLDALGKKPILIEWQEYPSMQVNRGFVEAAVQRCDQLGIDNKAKLLTLCRSGARSISAAEALTASGFENVFNVLSGFEGNKDDAQHRGNVDGWKFEQLPWGQN